MSTKSVSRLKVKVRNNIKKSTDRIKDKTESSSNDTEEGEASSEEEVQVNVIIPDVREESQNSKITDELLKQLLQSLDLSEDDFERGGWRPDAIHVQGMNSLGSTEIFRYFSHYTPYCIEWLNKVSCNVVWKESSQTAAALLGLSCPIKPQKNKEPMKKSYKEKLKKEDTEKMEVDCVSKKRVAAKGRTEKRGSNAKPTEDAMEVSDESSSSDSDDSDSDSSSSSSSSSDSSSTSSDSSSSEDSSSSSDESSSEDEDVELKKPVKEQRPNNLPAVKKPDKSVTYQNQDINEPVKDDPKKWEGYASAEDIGVPIPPGRWRLGLPCPNTKAIFMRFSHCKEKQMPGLKKNVEFYEGVVIQKNDDRSDYVRRRRREKSPARYQRRTFDDRKMFSRSRIKRVERFEMSPPPEPPLFNTRVPQLRTDSERGYRDLDDPVPEDKNPWGFLSRNWGHKETQNNLDYQDLLRKHLSGRKRKRSLSDSDDAEDDTRRSNKRSSRGAFGAPSRHSSGYDTPDSDFRDSDDEELMWRKRLKLPVMKMYADSEERRREKKSYGVGRIENRLGSGSSYPRHHGIDLRSKLRKKKSISSGY